MSHVWNRRYFIWWIIWWWIYDDDKFDWAIVFSLLSDSSDCLKVLKIFHSYCSTLFPFFREASIHCFKQFFFFFHFETSWSFIFFIVVIHCQETLKISMLERVFTMLLNCFSLFFQCLPKMWISKFSFLYYPMLL